MLKISQRVSKYFVTGCFFPLGYTFWMRKNKKNCRKYIEQNIYTTLKTFFVMEVKYRLSVHIKTKYFEHSLPSFTVWKTTF